MKIAAGYEFIYQLPQDTPMILMLNMHASRAEDMIGADRIRVAPYVPVYFHADAFGNQCARLVAPAGRVRISGSGTVLCPDTPDPVTPWAVQHAIGELPAEALHFLLGSRYCETDLLAPLAWELFGATRPGWARVQAVCDFVHRHISFDYLQARATRTALQTYQEQAGVCRDYAHLAIALCRALNIPARYCTGYLSNIGVPEPLPAPDFTAWMEVYLSGAWHVFDPRHNQPRFGRVMIGYGRDAADVAMCHLFGPGWLEGFSVWTHETN